MPTPHTTRPRLGRLRLICLLFMVALAALLASPNAALANSGTLRWGDGNVETFDNVSDLMARAKAVDGTVFISLSDDWFIKNARLEVPEGRKYAFYLNGHMINRQKAGSFGSQWYGEGDCQVFWVGKNATLYIDGGEKTTEHPGTLSDGRENSSGGTDYYFWTYDENGKDVLTGGLITGGACDDSDGAGGISVAGDGAICILRDVTVAGNISDEYTVVVTYYGCGGGVALHGDNCRLTLYGSKIIYNHAEDSGGGVYVAGENCTLEASLGSEISHNKGTEGSGFKASYGGGGICVKGDSCTIHLADTKISSNTIKHQRGGGISIEGDDVDCTLENCVVSGNRTSSDYYGSGGGIFAHSKGGSLSLISCEVSGNTTPEDGGGLELDFLSNISITGKSSIYGNTAQRSGGGICIYAYQGDEITISDSSIKSNSATKLGGGIYFWQTDDTSASCLTLVNGTDVSLNEAAQGGGIYLIDAGASRSATVACPDKSATISGNKAESGGGIYYYGCGSSIDGLTVSGNQASTGAGIYLSLREDSSSYRLADMSIRQNNASSAGGGVYIAPKEDNTLSLAGTVTIAGNTLGASAGEAAGAGDATGTPDNLNVPLEPSGENGVLLSAGSGGLSAQTRVGVTVRGFDPASGTRVLTSDGAAGWADAYNGYVLKSDNTSLSIRPAESGGQLRLFGEPVRVHVSLYGADSETPAIVDTWKSGFTATYGSADFAKDGQEPLSWEVEGLDGISELVPADGQVSFTVPPNDVTLRARYLPQASAVELGLEDTSDWDALGSDPKLVGVTSLGVTCSDGKTYDAAEAAVLEGASVQASADGASKTVTYTVRVGADALKEAGVYLGEATPEADAAVAAAKPCGTPAVSVARDGGDLVVSVMIECSRLDWLGEWEWEDASEAGGGARVTRHNGTETDVSVPSELGGEAVAEVAAGAFAGNAGLMRVALPATVASLGEGAFKGCSALAEVRVEASLASIGEDAFQGCAQGLTLYGPRACPAQAWAAANDVTYIPDTVLVTLDAADGTQAATQEIAYGASASKPDDPAHEGHAFLGWYAEGAQAAWDFATAVTADLTLTARWQSLTPTGFIDVPEDTWFYEWVTQAATQGLMSGYQDDSGAYTGYFGPDDPLTRGQVATILWRMAGSPDPAGAASFPDVEEGMFYTQAVAWCVEQHIVTGYKAGPYRGLFRPKADVSREELAVMVRRYAAWTGTDTSNASEEAFARCIDTARVSSWSRDSIVWCAAAGVVTGKDTPEGLRLDPQQGATRAQAAKVFVVTRAVTRSEVTVPQATEADEQQDAGLAQPEYAPAEEAALPEEATFDEVPTEGLDLPGEAEGEGDAVTAGGEAGAGAATAVAEAEGDALESAPDADVEERR